MSSESSETANVRDETNRGVVDSIESSVRRMADGCTRHGAGLPERVETISRNWFVHLATTRPLSLADVKE